MSNDLSQMIKDYEYRDKLFNVTTRATQELLTADSGEAFVAALRLSMEMIAQCIDIDCFEIWENEIIDGELHAVMNHYWLSEAGKQAIKGDLITKFSYSISPNWETRMANNESIQGLLCDLSQEDQDKRPWIL